MHAAIKISCFLQNYLQQVRVTSQARPKWPVVGYWLACRVMLYECVVSLEFSEWFRDYADS